MEIVIAICLLLIVLLVLHDKFASRYKQKQSPRQEKINPSLPDIMGQPKAVRSYLAPNAASNRQSLEEEIFLYNLDIQYDTNEVLAHHVSMEEHDGISINSPNLEEEEQEWDSYGIFTGDSGFAQGVTFEELRSVGMMLQKENMEPSQKETAVGIVQKIQGTELFNLLENSMESASRKIAELLDGSLSSVLSESDSDLQKKNFRQSDIDEFL